MFHKRSRKTSREIGGARKSPRSRLSFNRGLFIEPLESRQLLSVTLSSIGNQTVYAGAPLNLALDSQSDHPVSYNVSVSNSNLTSGGAAANLTTTVSDQNPSIRLVIDDEVDNIHGTVTIQLFEDLAPETVDRIMSLVNDGFYDDLTFHRIIEGFMIQGGKNDTYTAKFDDEFSPDLQFTGPGLVAMALNSSSTSQGPIPDTNGSQFFITVEPTRWLDFQHSIIGMVTDGMDVVNQLSQVPVDSATSAPVNNVVITSATVVNDVEDAVLRLSAPNGATGTADVTVVATDTVTNETTTRTFSVTVAADTTNDLPFLGKIDPIVTGVDTPVTVNVPATDVEGDAIYYYAGVSPANANLSVSIDHATGAMTVIPSNGAYGVFSIQVGVSDSTGNNWDLQLVPVYVNPAPPTSVTLAFLLRHGRKRFGRTDQPGQLDGQNADLRDRRRRTQFARPIVRRRRPDRSGHRHGDHRERRHQRHDPIDRRRPSVHRKTDANEQSGRRRQPEYDCRSGERTFLAAQRNDRHHCAGVHVQSGGHRLRARDLHLSTGGQRR